MKIDVKYLQKRSKGGWRYRRKVPDALRLALGKREIIFGLGSTETKAIKNYPVAHAKAERVLREAELRLNAPTPQHPRTETALGLFETAQKAVRDFGLDAQWEGVTCEDDPEYIARSVIAETIAAQYPVDDSGYPLGMADKDAAVLQALMLGKQQARPDPTIQDAKDLYLKEKVGDDEKKKNQLNHVFGFVSAAIGLERTISSLRREDAKEVLQHLMEGRSSATVDRYLNTIRAVFNYAIEELDLSPVRNRFLNLHAPKADAAEPERRKKKPFPDEAVTATRQRIERSGSEELLLIWRLLEGTGARLAEVTGLRTADLNLTAAVPHMIVEWHEKRRIKNIVSRRSVPLVGDALEAAKIAAGRASNRCQSARNIDPLSASNIDPSYRRSALGLPGAGRGCIG